MRLKALALSDFMVTILFKFRAVFVKLGHYGHLVNAWSALLYGSGMTSVINVLLCSKFRFGKRVGRKNYLLLN